MRIVAGGKGIELRVNDKMMLNNPQVRILAQNFPNILDVTFTKDNAKKQFLFKEGEKHFCGELFRFYSSILEWEQVYKNDP
jgi:hypothetical protein